MSAQVTLPRGPAPIAARDARRIIKTTAARLRGNTTRGASPKVRRDSYDVEDRRARVFSRIADGSPNGGLGFIDDLLRLAEEYDLTRRKPGKRAPLGAQALRVLGVMLRRGLRFETGRLDPAIRTVSGWTGYTYKTVHAALSRLRAHGFLNWVRRTRRVAAAGQAGPQRKQVANAYFFDLAAFGRGEKGVLQRWRDLRARRRVRLEGGRSATPKAAAITDPALADAFASFGASIEGRESPNG